MRCADWPVIQVIESNQGAGGHQQAMQNITQARETHRKEKITLKVRRESGGTRAVAVTVKV